MRIVLAAVVSLALAALAQAQMERPTMLVPGQPAHGTLEIDGSAEHLIELESEQFVYGEVIQHDVDVTVTIFDPNDNVADRFDLSARGAEPLEIETHVAGQFRIEISPAEEESGSYSINIERVEAVNTDPVRRLDQLLSQFTGDDVPGGVVAVVRDGEIVHSQSVGMANLVHDVPFDRNTVSNIGSVSKQFTAFAVTQLAYLGKLSLDDDVREYFPELPDLGQTVTVRHLLNHTNGYREFLNLLGMTGRGIGEGDYIHRDELIYILQQQPELQEEPGTKFNYNNTAYGLAALLVERITDVPFPQWMAENVFAPVGMENTQVRSHLGKIVPNAADGYVYAEDSEFRQAGDLGGGGGSVMGAGAVYSTVDDLARWMSNLDTAKVGGSDVIDEMTRPQIETPGEDSFYGLGLGIGKHRGLALISHGGADIAHRAQLLYYPEINAGVISLSNNGAFSGYIARETAEAFFADDMEPEKTPVLAAATDGGGADVHPAVFDPHLGKYEFDDIPGVVIDITRDDEHIYVQSPGDDPLQVSAASSTSLNVPPLQTIEFNVANDGRADSLSIGTAEDRLNATRLAEWDPVVADLEKYTGRYFSDELETFYTIAVGEEGLLIKHRRLEDIELTPKIEDSFNATFPITEIEFMRGDNGSVTGMMVSNIRTRNVRFEKQR
jgi:CubicO group peptidase (beta-lactamase class C family)